MNSFYNYEGEKAAKDSFSLLRVASASNKYQKGKLYIYKNLRKGGEEQWSAVFIGQGAEAVSSRIELVNSGYVVDRKASEQENVNRLLNQFYLGFRKRAAVTQTGPVALQGYE